jgi:hypothetical protein
MFGGPLDCRKESARDTFSTSGASVSGLASSRGIISRRGTTSRTRHDIKRSTGIGCAAIHIVRAGRSPGASAAGTSATIPESRELRHAVVAAGSR